MACACVSSRFRSAASCLPGSALRMLALRGWPGDVVRVWRLRLRRLHDPYRPELHYMRGPGPKWREKNQNAPDRPAEPAARRADGGPDRPI
jgi:hypothetical protein